MKHAPAGDNRFILRDLLNLFWMPHKRVLHVQHVSYSLEAKLQFTLNQYRLDSLVVGGELGQAIWVVALVQEPSSSCAL